jgi:hypothetical protein
LSRSSTTTLATTRTSTLCGTRIPPSCRRIGPGVWDYLILADIVDAWPKLPEAIKAGRDVDERGMVALTMVNGGMREATPLLGLNTAMRTLLIGLGLIVVGKTGD